MIRPAKYAYILQFPEKMRLFALTNRLFVLYIVVNVLMSPLYCVLLEGLTWRSTDAKEVPTLGIGARTAPSGQPPTMKFATQSRRMAKSVTNAWQRNERTAASRSTSSFLTSAVHCYRMRKTRKFEQTRSAEILF